MSIITSPELFINIKQKDRPTWIDGLSFDDQPKSTQDFWDNELDKIMFGTTINGVKLHPWLYFHINFWEMFIDKEDRDGNPIRVPDKPYLRDNEWFIQENLFRAEAERKGLFLFGTRRFGKSAFISSYIAQGAITEEGSYNSVVGGSTKDLGNVVDYIKFGISKLPDFFKFNIVGTDWNKGVELCERYTSGKEVWSKMAVTNVDQGELRSKEKAAGPTPSRYVMDEVGKYAFKPIYLAAKPSLETSKGFRTPPILLGTGGEVELSLDAQDVANNPEKFSLISMNWDMINDRCSEPTWKPRKWVVFVPTQMSTLEGSVKNLSTLDKYLGIEDAPDLAKIQIHVTDFDQTTKNMKEYLDLLSHGNDTVLYNKERMYRPFDPDDCFLSTGTNEFPVEFLLSHKSSLIDSGDTGRRVEVTQGPMNKLILKDSQKLMPEYPFKGGNVDAPVLVFEEPPTDNVFDTTYVCGMDPYKHKGKTNSTSLGTIYVLKRMVDINDPFANSIVLSYSSRPVDRNYFCRTCMYIQEGYGAMCLMENFDQTYQDYLSLLNKEFVLLENGEEIAQRHIYKKASQNNKFGLPATPRNQEYLHNLCLQYANEEIIVGHDNEGVPIKVPGAVRIKDIGLINEMIDYRDGGNYDRLVAFGHALALQRHYDIIGLIPKPRTTNREREKQKEFKKKGSFYTPSSRGFFK